MRREVAGLVPGAQRIVWLSDEEPALYRYRLDVELGLDGPPLCFLLHNPSVASHLVDDRSLRRMIGFGRREQASRITVVNPAGFRTAKPRELRAWSASGGDIAGLDNVQAIKRALLDLAGDEGRFVAAWGAIDGPAPFRAVMRAAIAAVLSDLRGLRMPVLCLGTTASGDPRHPLYLRASATLRPWPIAEAGPAMSSIAEAQA